MNKTIWVKVTGKVQGVGFRWLSYEKFVELDLKGTAENQSDGSIEITATGEVENLKRFLAWCKKGPSGSRVDTMDYKTIETPEDQVEKDNKA